ncbi:hypothetical protein F2Q68_00001897 [Brassica cretica]|uniref:Uncharacterized protein n=1 Tax=Brassica cretica TaxID=69181 RepID=A0A8S9JAA4_BRACR|nr:hypothetical protein F2Q68_00001897 [Brassica cretica]
MYGTTNKGPTRQIYTARWRQNQSSEKGNREEEGKRGTPGSVGNVSNGCLPLVSSSECDTGEDDSAEQVEQVPVEQLQFPVPVVQEAMVLRTQKVEAQAMLVPDQC